MMRVGDSTSSSRSITIKVVFLLTLVASCITIFVFTSGRDHLIEVLPDAVREDADQLRAGFDGDGERAYWISLADVDKHFRELQLGKRRVYKFRNRDLTCNWILRIGDTTDSGVSQYYHAAPFTTRGGDRGWHVFPYGTAMRMTDGIKWIEYPDREYLQAHMQVYHEVVWTNGSIRLSDPVTQAKAAMNGEAYQPEPFAVVWKGD